MPRHLVLAVARASCFAAALLATAGRATAGRAYVVESDFTTGSCSGVNTATRTPACDVASVHSDARVRWYGGRVYVVNRFGADNIEVLDGSTYAFVRQFSVGNGSNPYDIAFASPTKAYVTRYESADLWIVDPTTGAHTGTVSLAGLADHDGIPEMDRMMVVGPLLFVSLQRVDRANFFSPTDSSLVAVVDTRTDALVDCDAAHPGVQGIRLAFQNPVTPFVFDGSRTRLYLGCAGSYGIPDGGIVAVDPANLTSAGVVALEDSLGGDVVDLAWGGEAKAYAIVSDAAFNTSLVHWSAATGRKLGTLYSPGGFTLADAEVTPDGSEVWVCNSSFASPGLRMFRTATDLPVGGVVTCTLPPQGIAFDAATMQVAGVPPRPPGVRLAPPAPNPARGPVRFTLEPERSGPLSLDVLDVAGRHVRTLVGSGGPGESVRLEWDLLDERGGRVRPGLYLATCRTEQGVVSRRVLVIE